jgi:hypothetical protein
MSGVAHPDGAEREHADGDSEEDGDDADQRAPRLVMLFLGDGRKSLGCLVGHRNPPASSSVFSRRA